MMATLLCSLDMITGNLYRSTTSYVKDTQLLFILKSKVELDEERMIQV